MHEGIVMVDFVKLKYRFVHWIFREIFYKILIREMNLYLGGLLW